LVVVSPTLTPNTYIPDPDPTSPNFGLPVPLKTLQDCTVSIVRGTESTTPDFPAVPTGAVVISGVFLTPSMSVFPDPKYFMDTNKRDIYGRSSLFQQNFGRYDDRLRPYKSTNTLLGIKPSQLIHPNSRAFSFTNKVMPSIYPKTIGGLYNHADSFLNFQTGAITGGDGASSAFTPTIPSSGNYINATVGISTTDTVQVAYGTQGTRTQCLDGISSQVSSASAGGVAQLSNAKPVAIVTIYSPDGVNVGNIEYVDCRGNAAGGDTSIGFGTAGVATAGLPYTITNADRGRILHIDTTAGASTIQLPAPALSFKFMVVDVGGNLDYANCTILQFSGEKINGLAASYALASPNGAWFIESDGTNWFVF
jgi:hypothetical protein